MPETDRFSDIRGWIELALLEREQTPEHATKLGIQMYLAGLLLSDTVLIIDDMGVDQHRTTVHRWVQKADLQPAGGASPDHPALDEP